tara:strand:- start:3620 stop:4780 length:1161 start_codon:yes stop_codon:yes gene_type:complete
MLNNWPYYETDEINLVSQILSNGKVSTPNGTYGEKFETGFASFSNCKYALRLSNGTAALIAAYKSFNLKIGDEVITTPRSFIATTSAAVELGLIPVFADVDINSGNITAESIEPLINKKTKVISVVHIGGYPADMEKIQKLAKEYNLFLLEDCSQAHGAAINGKSVGSFSDIATWSFCNDKIISTGGEGGMITTNNKDLYEYVLSYRNHGKVQNKRNIKDDYLYKWVHDSIGVNLRLTEMQSAIGLIQLKKINLWHLKRKYNAQLFIKAIQDIPSVRIPSIPENYRHAWYKFYFYVNVEKLESNWTRNRIIKEINLLGFPAFQGSCSELYLENGLKNNVSKLDYRLTNAKLLGETSVMLLIHPTITKSQIKKYINAVRSILNKATF